MFRVLLMLWFKNKYINKIYLLHRQYNIYYLSILNYIVKFIMQHIVDITKSS